MLLVVCSALFFGVVNGSAVAVVLPEIGADLHIPERHLSWVPGGFLFTYGVAIPFYGRLASRFGARRLFLIGVATFSAGSGLSALAGGLEALLAARTVQALGGAAVPGLGMTLVARAVPEERRGLALGVVSATMGVAAAAGPLGAGLISEVANWRYLFAASALAAVNVPMGLRFLDRGEALSDEPLGLATTPFIPKSLAANRRYMLLTMLGFAIASANLGAQTGLPFLFKSLHGMTTLDIGVALVPAALTTAVVGVVAGRVADGIGATLPIRTGAVLMIAGAFALSASAGTSSTTVACLAMVPGAGFALINSPLVTVVSRLVHPRDLALALSLNTMMFFVGGSFGATVFTSIAVNTNFGNAFSALAIPAAIGFALSAALPRGPRGEHEPRSRNVERFSCLEGGELGGPCRSFGRGPG